MIALGVVAASMLPTWAQAAPTYINSQFASIPMNLANNDATPLVMLNMSRDHQLSYKAYTDYADLDNSGAPQTTYTDRIEYYGYFDSAKCYRYNTVTQRFEPAALASGPNNHYCTSNSKQWSGNFLNWATMTRMDVVRKLLYGGKRSTDTNDLTVLERQYLPTDAHAFAKYYDGADIDQLTPFTGIKPKNDPLKVSSTFNVTIGSGDKTVAAPGLANQSHAGDQIKVFVTGSETARWMIGRVKSTSGNNITITVPNNSFQGSGGNTDWTVRNLSRTGISLCNLTKGTASSHTNANPPIIRVADGNYALWNANEKWQCYWYDGSDKAVRDTAGSFGVTGSNGNIAYQSGLFASDENPSQSNRGLETDGRTGSAKGEYNVRVEVGKAGLIGQEKVKQYGITVNPIYKPIGLLQVYADQLHFGLMTGTYTKNVSGGVLRKNIKSFTDEINPANGTFITSANGIVHNLDRLRQYGYDYGDGAYINLDRCTYQQIGFDMNGNGSPNGGQPANQGDCSSWGNPMSEIYLESLRYLAGKTANADYTYPTGSTKDSALGLTTAPWHDPITQDNYCAPINVLNFNASVSGYDGDQVTKWSDICSTTAKELTDEVGRREHLDAAGSTWFIGDNGLQNNQLCSAKPIAEGKGFGDFAGLCPEAPTQKGAYLMAGMAHYANTNRIRSDLQVHPAREHSRDLMVSTYGIALATNVPKIEVDVAGRKVTILPAYRLDMGGGKYGGGTLVDFKVVEQTPTYGKYYVNWEDSEMGGDYDMDMWGTIEYQVTGSAIRITTNAVAAATNNGQGFGYIISGTTQDGAHFHSGIYNFNFTDPISGIPGCRNCTVHDSPTWHDYTVGSSTAGLLEDPLWYAAKWGGPLDSSGNPILRSDGSPANYFYAINPLQLENALNQVFLDIVKRTSSGTAAAVVANTVSGVGALYQAYYEPLRQDASNREVAWIGAVQAIWVDSYGYLREDAGTGMLGDYTVNPVVELYYDDSTNQTRIRRYVSARSDRFEPHEYTTDSLENLRTLWNARQQLSRITTPEAQRSFSSTADTGRFIKTWIDANGDGVVADSGEFINFDCDTMAGSFRYLGVGTPAEAKNIIEYVRGKEIAGFRNRTIDYDGNGIAQVMRLGDVVHSSPTVVGGPSEGYNITYRDASYAAFRRQYANRRQMVYVGANDGMLHAFNGGFYNETNNSFSAAGVQHNGDPAVQHPLGSEIWAYVPMNLLPHLKWLTTAKSSDPDDPNYLGYQHVYYVDGKPKVFDAKIFANDADHPEGWGTVLVVGMRFGGGPMEVDTTGSDDIKTFRSAYVIMDVTNPEAAPRLLAEIQAPDGSFTTSYPAVVAVKDTVPLQDANKWFLVFGSGPTDLINASTNNNAHLFLFDLAELTSPGSSASGAPPSCAREPINGGPMSIYSCDTGVAASFAGDPATVDWNLDYKVDSIYFGTAGDANAASGRMMRMTINNAADPASWSAPSTLIDVGQPVVAAPTLAVDDNRPRNKWIFFGTGRLFAQPDLTSTATQSLYGVIDNGTEANKADLRNTSEVQVQTDGGLTGLEGDGILNFNQLRNATDRGWYLNLPPIQGTAGTAPATRSVNPSALAGGLLFAPVYQPSKDQCTGDGSSRLYGLYYTTGTAHPLYPLRGTGNKFAESFVELGSGLASTVALQTTADLGAGTVVWKSQTSNTDMPGGSHNVPHPVRSGMEAWQER